jgi:hypothetical protein
VPAARVTADLILASTGKMGCAAFNVGAYDLSLGVDYLLEQQSRLPFPFVSANLVDPHGRLLFRPYVLVQAGGMKVGIFGLVDSSLKKDKIPASHKFAVKDPLETARATVAELRAKGADLIVLLTDMTSRSKRRMAMLEDPIHLIVGSDQRNQITLPITVQSSFLTQLDRGGRSVGRLEVYRGGREPTGVRGTAVGEFLFRHGFVQLLVEMPDHPVVGPLVTRTLKELSVLQERQAAEAPVPEDPDCGKEYVGIASCRTCHPARYRAWLDTRHAKAYETLATRKRQFDPECVVCHAVAFECEGDVIDWKALEGFTNVQCEACHGPGSLHVQSEGGEKLLAGRGLLVSCARCHTPERSTDLDLEPRFRQVCSEAD